MGSKLLVSLVESCFHWATTNATARQLQCKPCDAFYICSKSDQLLLFISLKMGTPEFLKFQKLTQTDMPELLNFQNSHTFLANAS